MIDLQLQPLSSTPLYEQVHARLKSKIEDGQFDSAGRLPSIKSLSRQNALSPLTITRAYKYLQKEGFINFISGKGYFITEKCLDRRFKVLVILNKFSFDRESVYYTIIDALGENKKVDLHVHHCNLPDFDSVMQDCILDRYNYYVLMPCFLNCLQETERKKLIESIPQDKIIFVDRPLQGSEDSTCFIFQSFKKHISSTLESAEAKLSKYHRIEILLSKANKYPAEIISGFKYFCDNNNKEFHVSESVFSDRIKRGTVYIVTRSEDLLLLQKEINATGMQVGKQVGIISFMETALSEFLDITAINSDWKLIAKEASELIINKQYNQFRNPFKLISRHSI